VYVRSQGAVGLASRSARLVGITLFIAVLFVADLPWHDGAPQPSAVVLDGGFA
jgi:hypothetical protein